jgi:hypothetical protein
MNGTPIGSILEQTFYLWSYRKTTFLILSHLQRQAELEASMAQIKPVLVDSFTEIEAGKVFKLRTYLSLTSQSKCNRKANPKLNLALRDVIALDCLANHEKIYLKAN